MQLCHNPIEEIGWIKNISEREAQLLCSFSEPQMITQPHVIVWSTNY